MKLYLLFRVRPRNSAEKTPPPHEAENKFMDKNADLNEVAGGEVVVELPVYGWFWHKSICPLVRKPSRFSGFSEC